MPNTCSNCYAEREIKAYINASGVLGKCGFCNSENVNILDINELFDFFKELIDNFKPTEAGQPLKNKIQSHWTFFSNHEIATKILNHVIDEVSSAFLNAEDLVDFNDEILENVNYWDKLKEELKWSNRYLTDLNYITGDLGWDSYFNTQLTLYSNINLYRARLHQQTLADAYSPAELFCPPKHISSAGRANPLGIPYLYLSDNENTVLYEVRASYLDEVSIGTFSVKPVITEGISIADFTENSSIFHPSKVNEKIKSQLLRQKISIDLSKPMRRYDSEIDYIPTQFICEFIRVYTGVNGIKFASSLHNTGNNFVIFDQNLMECTDAKKVKISRFRMSV
ncbi:RES domain-containing protein [Pedobacter psychrotolerans]|uniref:RES domain-containing protein n=1 Tax=Pedobacter psychrotolerans TaxID=1843235 RepID=A0A4R2HN86_9SPHI|nr:RES domain-containing protein [Pedobacter psychrotolerans]TCO30574.1 RES domain-containing protein [Pedobacter psychrotolerans]GGE69165.1 hypothetical protein GCM10011413_39790 [Pedobacter psychrotolerans]